MADNAPAPGFHWADAELNCSHDYLLPALLEELGRRRLGLDQPRLFDLGCGNGSVPYLLQQQGWQVTGIDPSEEGIALARERYPDLDVHSGSAYDDLVADFGRYPLVISLEVVEHLYAPRQWAATLFDLLEPGGEAIVSTPYHGYWKNLALALSGRMDAHFTALWDHGHIKFWSIDTLGQLLQEAGFESPVFTRVGRVPALAKSMMAVVRKPG